MRLLLTALLAALISVAAAQEPLPLKLKDGSTLQVIDVRTQGAKVTVRTSNRQSKTLGPGDFQDPRAEWQTAIRQARSQERWVDSARSARMLANLFPKDAGLERQQGDLLRERDRKMTDAVRTALDKGDGRRLEALSKAAKTDAEYSSSFDRMLRGMVADSLTGSDVRDYSKRKNEYKALSRAFPNAYETKALGQVVAELDRELQKRGSTAPAPADGGTAPARPGPGAPPAGPAAATGPAPAEVRDTLRKGIDAGFFAQAQDYFRGAQTRYPQDQELAALGAEIGAKYTAWIEPMKGAEGGREMTAGGATYRLYVPKSWSAATRPPVIYAFSSEAEAEALVKELAPFADATGAFVAAAKVSTEWSAQQQTQGAMAADVAGRLAVDARRSVAVGPPLAAFGMAAAYPNVCGGAIAVGTNVANISLTTRAAFPAVLLYPKDATGGAADAARAIPAFRARGIALTAMDYEGGSAGLPPAASLQTAVSALSRELSKPAPAVAARRAETFY